MRTFHALVMAVCLVVCGSTPALGQSRSDVIEIITERAAAHGVSAAWLIRVASCETGGTFNPASRGDGGRSWGLFQLHERGLRPLFYQMGYSDPDNAWEASDFAAWAFANGYSRHWSCR